MAKDDLWGDLPKAETLRTPLVILKEQAELLEQKTGGLLVGQIGGKQSGTGFQYQFSIVAPTLNNYSYSVLIISHDIGFYPVTVEDPQGWASDITCSNVDEYKAALKAIFSKQEVQDVISKLLTHISSST